jgi:hypothetical protein
MLNQIAGVVAGRASLADEMRVMSEIPQQALDLH